MKSRGANDRFWHLTIFFKERDYLDLHQSYFFVLFSERRAHSNLGNAHIFLGEFERAADHYKRTLLLAQDLGDRAVEAQACYRSENLKTKFFCLQLFQKHSVPVGHKRAKKLLELLVWIFLFRYLSNALTKRIFKF